MHYAIDTGVGIVSVYFLSGFVRTSFKINESAPHFLCIILTFFAAGNHRYLVGMSGMELAGRIIENTGGVHIATDYTLGARTEAFWAGWSLAYLQWCTGMAFELRSRNGIDIHNAS